MPNDRVVEHQMLRADAHAASLSLFTNEFQHSVLMQVARIATGYGRSVSVYAVYREGPMTFEASARLLATRPRQSLESLLLGLIEDADFLDSLLIPLRAQVERHFAPERSSA